LLRRRHRSSCSATLAAAQTTAQQTWQLLPMPLMLRLRRRRRRRARTAWPCLLTRWMLQRLAQRCLR
jgi:hypothetical protein